MDNERQKKIEAGKLKLAEFKKKRLKNEKAKKLSENLISSTVQENCGGNLKEKQTTEESTSMNNCTMKEYSSYDTNKDNAVDKSSAQEGVLQLSDESDDSVPFPEEAELVSLYDQKIKKYQEAICQRDVIIQQLSCRLESAMNMNQAKESAGNQEVQNLKEEINMLHLQMKEAAELLEKQKSKNEIQANIQNAKDLSSSSCISKFELGIQVDAKEIPSLQSFDFKNTSLFNDVLLSDSTSDDSSFFVIQKVSECLQDKISHVQLQELVKLIKERLDLIEAPHHAKSNNDCNLVTNGQGKGFNSSNEAMSTLLKRIISLNIVAKLIESLISIAPVSTSASATDFSPSKFQSFFLKRLNSSETDDLIPDISENESVPSDINYAEVETPCRIPSANQSIKSSIEKLRNKNISEDINLVTEFLTDEMEKISESVSVFKPGAQGNSVLQCKEEVSELREAAGTSEVKNGLEYDYESILRQKAKLEIRIKNLKQLDKELLEEEEQNVYQRSVESDTLVNSEDNLLMDEPPLSCVSLLSLTDSECKTEYVTTDSETNFSRKVSFDMTKSAQEQEICVKCEKYLELVKVKYEDEIYILKETLENNHSLQKTELLESIKVLESEIEKLKSGKDNLNVQLNQQIELLCKEHELKIQYLTEEHNKALTQLQNSCSKYVVEKDELVVKVKDLENKLNLANEKALEALDEKAKIECSLPIQIADLVQEHQQDLEALKTLSAEQLNQEKKKLEMEHLASIEMLKKLHDDEIEDLRSQIQKEFQEKEEKLINEHSKAIGLIEAAHSDESATYQKKIEQLLEEKCELLSKTTHEYETILKKNHKALIILCNQLRAKVNIHKQRMLNSSLKSFNSDKDVSEFDIFDDLNSSLESGLVKFLNQNYFMSNANKRSDDAEYLEERSSLSDLEDKANDPKKSNMTEEQNLDQMEGGEQMFNRAISEVSIDSDDMQMIYSEINKLQEEFQKDVAMYKDVNEQLHQECKTLRKQIHELEHHKEELEMQLHAKEKELVDKESQLASMDAAAVKGGIMGSQLSSTDIRSWQVHAAQTNSRLLHVLSDLVKTFLDIENDINTHLLEHGLIPSRAGNLQQHDDETGQSVGSREDFTSLSLGECPNLELTEDGPDLTPRAWDLFSAVGTYDTEMEGEDVVLGASRRLRLAVDHVLNLLTRALENQQNQDLKLLLKRNEELSQELQEESQGRDAVHMELVTAESLIRKLEVEKLKLEDLNCELKENEDLVKRELSIERNKVAHLEQEKETFLEEIHVLKEQCDLLTSRLGDPEKTENGKMLNSSDICMHEKPELLQENSRLSSEKQTVQKNLSKERQSFLDRLHQMEIALDELNAEKEDLVEKKCKEIRDLKAEMEAMDKQLLSNRKFIEEQALEREQEREDFIKEINRMQEFVREKEKIQSNEAQLTKEIESLEQLLRARIEDHKNVMMKKDDLEKELRQSLDKIRDLRDIIEELEKQLDFKSKTETELRLKLASMCETLNAKEEYNTKTDNAVNGFQTSYMSGDSTQQIDDLKERIASQSQEIETMSQSQTLLHELRGQIHFLEAKVEQRAKQIEAMNASLSSSPIQSSDTSPSSSQDTESLHIQYEDGFAMSPRSVHWLEIRRLEEKIGHLTQLDEDLIRKNKELERQLRELKMSCSEYQHINAALQEKYHQQFMQTSALKLQINDQNHDCGTPPKNNTPIEKFGQNEEYEKQLESNKRLLSELQEAQTCISALQLEINQKDTVISSLQKIASELFKEQNFVDVGVTASVDEQPTCMELLLLEKNKQIDDLNQEIEHLKEKLQSLQQKSSDLSIIEKLKKELEMAAENSGKVQTENSQLRSQIESLENEVKTLKDMLEKAEKEIESERVQVETLCEEIANISQNSMKDDSLLPISDTTKLKLEALEKVKVVLTKKLEFYENQLKEKNIEIQNLKVSLAQLKSTLQAKEKDLEIEQVQVDTLLQELGSLVSYQKRLEQDFNIVQDMMHQKERELETLHEETEAQMKLEAEVESLEKLLEDQKNIELDLKQRVNELEEVVENAKYSVEQLKAQWKSNIEELEKAHQIDIGKMKNQIDVLKQNIIFNQDTEDIDIANVKKEIVASALAFRLDQNEEKLQFENIVYATLKRTIDAYLKKLEKKHETNINDINENWQQKIKAELESKEKDMRSHYEKYKKDKIQLQKKFEKEKIRISSEKDAYWQGKLKELGKSLSDEKGKNEKISKLLEYIEGNLQETHQTQVNSLKSELDQILKEKIEAEKQVRNLSKNIEELKQEISALQKSFKSKIHSMEENFESEKMQLESFYKLQTEKLQSTLHSALEREKTLESKHKEELSDLHKFFETQWKNEMKKIQSSQIEELKKLKDSKDKNIEALCNNYFKVYEEKLNKMQERCEFQIAEERKQIFRQHREELLQLRHALEERFEREKVTLIEMKEKELKAAFDSLNKALNVKVVDSTTKENKDWEKEKSNLISQHQNEMALLKRELQQKYEKKLQNQLMAHSVEMKHVEDSYNQQVEELHELIKEAKRVASRTCHSDSGSNRTTTPSSEMTSSDEACSSCQEDMLSRNKHVLVNKIHQDGKRVLSLIESSQKPVSSEIEVKHWLDERKWVINKVKSVVIIDDPEDVKLAVSKLVEEIHARKRNFEIASKENQELREKCFGLELKLREENSKLHDVTVNLNKQNSINSDLQYLLRLRTTEMTDLRKSLEDQVRFSLSPSLKNTYSHQSENLTSSYEIGCLRSADEPRSHEQFSMLLPEIPSIPSKDPGLKVRLSQSAKQKRRENDFAICENVALKRNMSIKLRGKKREACDEYKETAFQNLTRRSESEMSDVKQELLNKQITTFEQLYEQTRMSPFSQKDSDFVSSAKLHSLYCICRRIRSHNKALIYQKKYLLKLLAYFETTENFTLAWLNNLAINSPVDQSSNSSLKSTIIVNGKFRFRSMAFAVVAVHRLKLAVRRHRLLSRVPAARVVNVEIQSIFQKYPHFSPTVTPDECHLSTVSLSSKSASVSESYEECKNSATSIESRAENKQSKSSVRDKSQLVQYVHRLAELQKQLGLDTFS